MPILLQINISANNGSTGKIAESIGELAIKNGWDSYIAYGGSHNSSQSKLIKIGSKIDIYTHYLLNRIFDGEGLGSIYSTKKLIMQIENIKPNIIHLHNLHDHYLNYKLLFQYLNKTKTKVVWTFHDCWALTGHCANFSSIGCEKWKTGCYDCPQNKSLFDFSKRNYDLKKNHFNIKNLYIITVSDWLKRIVQDSFLGNHYIKIIKNGVDINVFHPVNIEDFKNTNDSYRQIKEYYDKINKIFTIIGVASVWTEGKGINDYIKLSELLDKDECLVLIGINKKIEKNMPKNIICVPRMSSMDLLAFWYTCADVVLSLSKQETFGMTIAEGMACGTPAIVYDNTAQPELISDDTGYVVENGNIKQCYKKIQEIKKRKSEYYIESCRERAISCWSKENLQEYINLYESVLKTI